MKTCSSTRIAYGSDSTVLITGPTGTGKTRLARQIHDGGRRASRPFVTVNLATVHEGTLESELFGHERGAFTGASARRVGKIESAQGGTLFLDELGELSLPLQARLLEFLQSRTLSRLGSNRVVPLDVRVIAATHRDLQAEVERGTFRADLFHRLRVVTIRIPEVRERPEEFNDLLHACLHDVCLETGRTIHRISEGAAERLETYRWPGNVREMRNVLEYATLSAAGSEITAQDLPPWFGVLLAAESVETAEGPSVLGVAEIPLGLDYQGALARFEREYLKRALGRYRGRINKTAQAIGMNKTTLIRRIRAYSILGAELELG